MRLLSGARVAGSTVPVTLIGVGLVVVGAILAVESPLYGAILIGGVWLFLPARQDATPKWMTFLLLGIVFGSLLPNAISLLFQGVALVAAYALWLATPSRERRAGATLGWVTAILAYWALLAFHANIPSIDVGILGFRKTVYCLVGLALGASVLRRNVPAVERTVVKLLIAAVGLSIALYLFAPGLEQTLVERNADEYTGVLGGVARLQGVFAGPFHAASAGLMLAVWGFARFATQRAMALLAAALGLGAIYLTLVRTAYVALIIAILCMLLTSATVGKAMRRIITIAAVGAVGISVAASFDPAALSVVESIGNAQSDTRFLGRFPGYLQGIDMFNRSPIIGWGAGSAGDTLGSRFLAGEHITSHNVVLKIAVEGGLIGLVLWAGVVISIVRRLRRGTALSAAAAGMLGAVLGMGITGSSLETLPPTFLVFMIVGLALDQAPPRVGELQAPERKPARMRRVTRP